MLDLPENELFSAYIDGELTADEQAEVERILASNPDAQQLVDELRSLSHSLQALPAYKLDEDLAARVLRQAEREMLAQPAAPLPKFHQVDVPESKPISWARRLLRPRNFAWSAVAIAVAIILAMNESNTNNGPSKNVAQTPKSGVIEPLGVAPSVQSAESPPIPTVAEADNPREIKNEPRSDVPGVVPTASEPNRVAEAAPKARLQPETNPSASTDDSSPLLVLQCQLAEGRVGHEALAELLKQAGIATDEPISPDAQIPFEITLTTDQVCEVVSQLQTDTTDFTGFSFLATPKTAPPRISSAIVPGDSYAEEMTAEEPNAKKPPKATFHVQGTLTIQPKAAPGASPAETTNADGNSSRTKVRAKVSPSKTPKSLPVKEDSTYRVRFVFKPAEKPVKSESPTEK